MHIRAPESGVCDSWRGRGLFCPNTGFVLKMRCWSHVIWPINWQFDWAQASAITKWDASPILGCSHLWWPNEWAKSSRMWIKRLKMRAKIVCVCSHTHDLQAHLWFLIHVQEDGALIHATQWTLTWPFIELHSMAMWMFIQIEATAYTCQWNWHEIAWASILTYFNTNCISEGLKNLEIFSGPSHHILY